jgi:hypothetical protein
MMLRSKWELQTRKLRPGDNVVILYIKHRPKVENVDHKILQSIFMIIVNFYSKVLQFLTINSNSAFANICLQLSKWGARATGSAPLHQWEKMA